MGFWNALPTDKTSDDVLFERQKPQLDSSIDKEAHRERRRSFFRYAFDVRQHAQRQVKAVSVRDLPYVDEPRGMHGPLQVQVPAYFKHRKGVAPPEKKVPFNNVRSDRQGHPRLVQHLHAPQVNSEALVSI